MCDVCDSVVLQQHVFASVLSVLSHLCVFMQLSLRSVWRCTWMAIAAPLATCGGYPGRRAGGGHGVGGMRKACYLCQVEVVFQQRRRVLLRVRAHSGPCLDLLQSGIVRTSACP